MEQNSTTETTQPAAPARPTLLTVLCILTWIGSGLGALVYLLLAIAAGAMGSMLSKVPGVGALLGAGVALIIVAFLAAVGKIFGAVQMWKLKKTGFYIYTACEVVLFGVGAYMAMQMSGPGGGFPVMGLVWTALFVTLYGLNLKHMK